jgi:hypothetical protein
VRRKLQFDNHPHLLKVTDPIDQRHLLTLPEISPDVNSKERVVALAKLNLVAYDLRARTSWVPQVGYGDEAMQGIFDDPSATSVFGDDISSNEAEIAAVTAFYDAIVREVADTEATYKHTYRPHETQFNADGKIDENAVGVAALEFQRGNLRVLTFRGTVGKGDVSNIINWLHDWIFEKMLPRMKEIWVDDAGLEWDQTMETRSQEGVAQASAVICSYHYATYGQVADTLAGSSNVSLTKKDAEETGYWEITKAITFAAHSEVEADNGKLLITGHSQGGTRAALASMLLAKRRGVRIPTITFAATGKKPAMHKCSACLHAMMPLPRACTPLLMMVGSAAASQNERFQKNWEYVDPMAGSGYGGGSGSRSLA